MTNLGLMRFSPKANDGEIAAVKQTTVAASANNPRFSLISCCFISLPLQSHKTPKRYDGVEIPVSFDNGGKVPVIDKHGARRLSPWHGEFLQLALNLVD